MPLGKFSAGSLDALKAVLSGETAGEAGEKIISDAAADHKMVDIIYQRKRDEVVVDRRVAPYEFKTDKLWAACKLHDMGIHSWIRPRILAVEMSDEKFEPKWPVKIAGELEVLKDLEKDLGETGLTGEEVEKTLKKEGISPDILTDLLRQLGISGDDIATIILTGELTAENLKEILDNVTVSPGDLADILKKAGVTGDALEGALTKAGVTGDSLKKALGIAGISSGDLDKIFGEIAPPGEEDLLTDVMKWLLMGAVFVGVSYVLYRLLNGKDDAEKRIETTPDFEEFEEEEEEEAMGVKEQAAQILWELRLSLTEKEKNGGITMPMANFHAARVRPPDDFIDETFRTKETGGGIQLIMGKLKKDGKGGPMTVQAFRFDASKWTEQKAKAWLKDHEEHVILFEPVKKMQEGMNPDSLPDFLTALQRIDKRYRKKHNPLLAPAEMPHMTSMSVSMKEQAQRILSRLFDGLGAPLDEAVWDSAFINTLPDSCFAYIEPGGKKDKEGKTVPRSLRHLPYKNKDGKVDLPHLRNALARLSQTDISGAAKKKAQTVLNKAAKAHDVGQA